ncbi:MAG: type II secretion system GspH family protein, partial [Verrucomicrobiae bacterium]|nr:type II secretion system GspH family protein [Verrucomicrobiae bacterium]NNJ87425.1 type II secretion system protein [Akkermansiaceae bacterium]
MKKPLHPITPGAPGFTLIELMVVIAIILVLSTIVIGGLGWYKRKAAVGKTEVLVASIDRALEDYKLDNGFLPEGNGDKGSTQQVY